MSALRRIAPVPRLARRASRRLASTIVEVAQRRRHVPRPPAPLVISCHHKSGSTLMHTVFARVARDFGWRLAWIYREAPDHLPEDADVIVLGHAQLDLSRISRPYLGAHLIRDPRDVIVSGYQYHLDTDELWCTNRDLDPTPPISLPQVPYWIAPRSEEWKRAYLDSLGGRSYQDNLNARSQDEGILFEMERYSAWTIDQMLAWDYDNPRVVELKFEDVLANFDAEMRRMFVALGLEGDPLERAIEIAATEDLGRMDPSRLQTDPHIRSRGASRWERYFTDEHRRAFKERFGDAVVRLGYAASNDW